MEGFLIWLAFGAWTLIVILRSEWGGERPLKPAVARASRDKIQAIDPSTVRITGRALPSVGTMSTPISDRPCLAYTLVVEEHVGRRAPDGWRTVKRLTAALPFYVQDDRGRVLVDPSGHFELALDLDVWGRTNFLERRANLARVQHLEDVLEREGISTRTWLGFSKSFRYSEGMVLEGEVVSVAGGDVAEGVGDDDNATAGVGVAAPNGVAGADREGMPGEIAATTGEPGRVVVRGTASLPLMISDDEAAPPAADAPS